MKARAVECVNRERMRNNFESIFHFITNSFSCQEKSLENFLEKDLTIHEKYAGKGEKELKNPIDFL